MKGYLWRVVLLNLIIGVACSRPRLAQGSRPTPERGGPIDEAAVWRATLSAADGGYSAGAVSLREISAADEDIPESGIAAALKGHEFPHAAQLVHQYLEINRAPVFVTTRGLSRSEVVAVASGNTLAEGRRLYQVSRVACVENYCLTYVEYFCGPKCGKGTYFVLEWTNDRWTIRDTIRAWIS
jgi:hypothetical protein